MCSKRYAVKDQIGITLGTFESLDLALCFIEGYVNKYYQEKICLIIEEIKEEIS